MKKLYLLFILMFSAGLLWSQNGGFNYKAVISQNGTVLANQSVSMRFTILENGSTSVYQEVQTGTTDANGIIGFHIGEGTVISGDFSTIDWGAHTYFLKTELDTGSGFQNFGMSEFKWVPYAKYADKAGNVFSGDFNDLTNIPPGLSDGDDDTHLTDADIAAMGYIKSPDDADHDPSNELQTLTLTGNQLAISNGNNVTFAGWDTDTTDDVHALNDLSDARVLNHSIGLGNMALHHLSTGTNNVAVGEQAGFNNNAGGNVFVGYLAGKSVTGINNVIIGAESGRDATGSGNIFIGYSAGINEHGSNKLYIDNSSTATPLIYGDFANNALTINGSLAIKDGTQGAGKVLVSDASGKAHWEDVLNTDKILIIGPLDAKTTNPTDEPHLVKDFQYGAYFNNSGNRRMYFPLRLPEGAKITSITFHYRMPSFKQDFHFYFLREQITQTNSPYNIASTTGDYTSHSTTINFATPIVISHNFDYFFEVDKNDWTGDNHTSIKAIEVHYTE